MALGTSTYKSVGIILGIAVVGVIAVVATIRFQGGTQETGDTKPIVEETSGAVFDVPNTWTIGAASTNTVQLRVTRVNDVQSQRSTCTVFSKEISQSIATNLENNTPNEAQSAWQKQYPGLILIDPLQSASGTGVLVGIDTCNETLTNRVITLRGQLYKSNVEIRLSLDLPQNSDTSTSELRSLANSIATNQADSHTLAIYTAFKALIQSAH